MWIQLVQGAARIVIRDGTTKEEEYCRGLLSTLITTGSRLIKESVT